VARSPSLMRARTVTSSAPSTPTTSTDPAPLWTSSTATPSASTVRTSVRSSWASRLTTLTVPKPSAGTATTQPSTSQAVRSPGRRSRRVPQRSNRSPRVTNQSRARRNMATSALQPPQHGEHPAVVVLGGGQVQLHEDVADVLLDGALAHHQLAGDGGVGAALGHEAEHLALAGRQPVERVAPAGAGQQLGDDLGVERRAAGADPAHGLQELGHVGDAVLQEVAEAGGVVGQQLAGVGLLDVLGEDEDADAG